jgi:hypothetical protein
MDWGSAGLRASTAEARIVRPSIVSPKVGTQPTYTKRHPPTWKSCSQSRRSVTE